MRPLALFPLFRSVESLKGVGPSLAQALARLLGGARDSAALPVVRDVLFHLPTSVVDRRQVFALKDAPVQTIVSLKVMIEAHYPPQQNSRRARKSPYRIACRDESGEMLLIFFNARGDYLQKMLPAGQVRYISGMLELFDGVLQMAHPEVIASEAEKDAMLTLEPQYPLTHGLSMKKLRQIVGAALKIMQPLPEWQRRDVIQQQCWPDWCSALRTLHLPDNPEDIARESLAYRRLAYDELLASQLSLAIIRQQSIRQQGVRIDKTGRWREQLLARLPFSLTEGQQQVLQEIDRDFASGHRMLRLLQGDVGSGKTIVALLAMMPVLEAGFQCALMVPTDILGRQHLASMLPLIDALGINAAVLSGKLPAAERTRLQQAIAAGEIQLVVGTHALFQETSTFHRLGFVVIDEQHRFGVKQRLALTAKGQRPHVLLMTATPIPRSLTMTAYGDMDSSVLPDKPAHRQPIDTRVVPLSRLPEVVKRLGRAFEQGARAYWICPLVEEPESPGDDAVDLAAAESRYKLFKEQFGERVSLMHGRMSAQAREEAMQAFANGESQLLVATTVVEVGVNVPEATIIVIEHAERFGLAQLHQLRGRVGRGAAASSCILLYSERLSEVAQQRLRAIRETNDGFKIAEEDLVLRGAGDVLGTRQSGMPHFHFADLALHRDLVFMARDDVKLLLHDDPTLQTERGEALRTLLYLFGYDASLRYLQAG